MKTIVTVKRITPLSGMDHLQVYNGDKLVEVFSYNDADNEIIAWNRAMALAAKLEAGEINTETIIYQTPKP